MHPGDPKSNAQLPVFPWYLRVVRGSLRGSRGSPRGSLRASPRASLTALVWLAVGLIPAHARAFEDAVTLGVGGGYAHAVSSLEPEHGARLVLSGSIELDGPWALRPRTAFSHHPGAQSLQLVEVSADLVYLVDIIEIVPYFGTGLGVLGVHAVDRRDELELEPLLQDVIGLYYLVSFDLAIELEAGVHMRPLSLTREPLILTLTASLVWILPE